MILTVLYKLIHKLSSLTFSILNSNCSSFFVFSIIGSGPSAGCFYGVESAPREDDFRRSRLSYGPSSGLPVKSLASPCFLIWNSMFGILELRLLLCSSESDVVLCILDILRSFYSFCFFSLDGSLLGWMTNRDEYLAKPFF